jgi:hypothetical protein
MSSRIVTTSQLGRILTGPRGTKIIGLISYTLVNVIHYATLWVLRITMNDLYINRKRWSGLQMIWRKTTCMLSQWLGLLSGDAKESLNNTIVRIEKLAQR